MPPIQKGTFQALEGGNATLWQEAAPSAEEHAGAGSQACSCMLKYGGELPGFSRWTPSPEIKPEQPFREVIPSICQQ